MSLLLLMLLLAMSYLVNAQYGHQQSYNYGGGGGGGYGGHGGSDYDAMEDRPKVNLGIRLRIPAFKFELPRFSLPKITVSAKIRQPEGPRVIQLPEINLDTSSKSELPNNKMHGGGGGGGAYDNQYQGPAYGMAASSYGGGNQHYGGQEKASVFSFSTEEERPAYKPQYKPMGNTYQTMGSKSSYQPYMQQQQQQQQSYSSSEVNPSYSIYSKPPGADQPYHYQQESAKNPDIGFNSPAYVGAQQANAAKRRRA